MDRGRKKGEIAEFAVCQTMKRQKKRDVLFTTPLSRRWWMIRSEKEKMEMNGGRRSTKEGERMRERIKGGDGEGDMEIVKVVER